MSEATVNSISQAISRLDIYTNSVEYKSLSPTIATQFKSWLLEKNSNGRAVSVTTVYHALRHVKKFLRWLSGEPGYRSGRLRESADYLTLDKGKVREATAQKYVESPTLEYVLRLVDSIKGDDEISRRDRALIAFLLCSGMRDLAVATLPLGCFERDSQIVHQDPAMGVRTKFSKTIHTKLLPFDDRLIRAILSWHDYLACERKLSPDTPFFPRTKSFCLEGESLSGSIGVEPVFWKTAGPIRKILKERSVNAGLPYFKPHTFRHALARLFQRLPLTPEQLKAVSQNMGHENIGTTLLNYGKLSTHQALEVVGKIDFGSSPKGKFDKAQLASMIALLQSLNDE